MEIVKKRFGDQAIIIIDNEPFRAINIDDSLWDSIVRASDDLEEYFNIEFSYIYDTLKECLEEESEDNPQKEELIERVRDLMFLLGSKEAEEFIENEEEKKQVYGWADLDKIKRNDLADTFLEDFSDEFYKDDEGYVYMKGSKTMVPVIFINNLLDSYHAPEESNYTVESLLNFWRWLIANPDKHVRTDLFKWISTGEWSITDEGMIISYRNVITKDNGKNRELAEFVTENYLKVKRWKKSPKNYSVFKNGEYTCVLTENVPEGYNIIGTLEDLYENYVDSDEEVVYKPQYSGPYGQEIKIGTPVSMPREECDNDPSDACSRGLHQKSKAHGMGFGNITLICLVNPYNVVAVPKYDSTKFRTQEYLPIGIAEKDENGDLVEWEGGTYQMDYPGYTEDKLVDLFDNNQVDILKKAGLISEELEDNVDYRFLFDSRDVSITD